MDEANIWSHEANDFAQTGLWWAVAEGGTMFAHLGRGSFQKLSVICSIPARDGEQRFSVSPIAPAPGAQRVFSVHALGPENQKRGAGSLDLIG